MDLEDLVNEAAKIYRIPTPKKNPPTIILKENFSQIRKKGRKDVQASLLEKSSDSIHKEKETNFEKRRKELNYESSKKDFPRNKFYEDTKEWLGLIYGKNSSKRLQSNKRMQRFDETTSLLIKDMLSKEINYAEK
jgi:hypothetical protein